MVFEGQLFINDYTKISDWAWWGSCRRKPSWMGKLCCRVAGKTRSSVFARLSCRWCSFIHAEMSARQPEKQEVTPEEPQWPFDVLWIAPIPRPPRKTYQWNRIQTSEVESLWCPVMRGWTGGSDLNWHCRKQQIDPAERGLMIWNQLLQFAGLQWLREAQSQLNSHSWNLTGLRTVCCSVKETMIPDWKELVLVFSLWMEGER